MALNGFWVSLAVGTLLGILTGLGVGGGSLLLLWLTAAADMAPDLARGISLLFFLPAAFVSGLLRRDAPPWKALLPGILCGVVSAAIFSGLARVIDPGLFQKGLGILLIFTGLQQLIRGR